MHCHSCGMRVIKIKALNMVQKTTFQYLGGAYCNFFCVSKLEIFKKE